MMATQFREAAFGTAEPIKNTQSPIVTGASVLAVKYKDGVMLMADTLGSYGSMAMFKSIPRINRVNDYTMIGGGGEISDLQYIQKLLESLAVSDFCQDDGALLTPNEIHSYLSRVLYNRRSKVDPLWNQLIVAGYQHEKSFLGFVDLYGSSYTDVVMATGFGQYMAIPLLRKGWKPDMTFEEARALLETCMRVLFYRDCRTINNFQLATITKDGPLVSQPYALTTFWEHRRFVDPNNTQ